MKTAIIDDQQEEIQKLSELISERLISVGDTEYNIDTFSSGEAFLSSWRSGLYDLIILDIYMEGMNGIEVARKIRETDRDVRLVFCSSSNEFAGESYELNAHFYLRKPYSREHVNTMLTRLNVEAYEMKRSVLLPDGRRIILRNVLYTEYSNHVINIHQKQGETIRCYLTQAQAEALFCKFSYFLVSSRGIIVNLHEVDAKLSDSFRLSNGEMIPISRRKSREVQDAYAKFHFEKLRKEM